MKIQYDILKNQSLIKLSVWLSFIFLMFGCVKSKCKLKGSATTYNCVNGIFVEKPSTVECIESLSSSDIINVKCCGNLGYNYITVASYQKSIDDFYYKTPIIDEYSYCVGKKVNFVDEKEDYVIARTGSSLDGKGYDDGFDFIVPELFQINGSNFSNIYYLDAKNGLDAHSNPGARRPAMVKFRFSPRAGKNYALNMYNMNGSTIGDREDVVDLKVGNPNLLFREESINSQGKTTVTGTVQVNLSNFYKPFVNKNPTFSFVIQEYESNYALPHGSPEVYSSTASNIQVNTQYQLLSNTNTLLFKTEERKMNVFHYYNPLSTFKTSFLNSSYTFNGRVFRQVFDEVWKYSDAHVCSDQKEINDLPLWLVDKNGKAVILKEDIENDIELGEPEDQIDQALKMWHYRLAYYHHLKLRNQNTDISIQDYNIKAHSATSLNFDSPQYFNTLGLIAINGYALYSISNTTNATLDFYSKLEEKKYNFDAFIKSQLPPNPLFDNKIGLPRGTTFITNDPRHNPISVVDMSAIGTYVESRYVTASAFGTACHELAHAWCYLALEDGIENDRANHASHITGEGSNYCLFRTVPKGMEYDNTLTNEEMSQFLIQKTISMKFSKGIQQRLANRFSVSKK